MRRLSYGTVATLVGGPMDGLETRVSESDWLYFPVLPDLSAIFTEEVDPSADLPMFQRDAYVMAFYCGHPSLDDQGRVRCSYRGRF